MFLLVVSRYRGTRDIHGARCPSLLFALLLVRKGYHLHVFRLDLALWLEVPRERPAIPFVHVLGRIGAIVVQLQKTHFQNFGTNGVE